MFQIFQPLIDLISKPFALMLWFFNDITGSYVVAIFFFAFSSIIGNYYYGEANIAYISKKRWAMVVYRLMVGAMVMFGAVTTLQTVWSLADLTMALMTICNLAAIVLLGRRVIVLLDDYMRQRREGKDPVFKLETVKDKFDTDGIECW